MDRLEIVLAENNSELQEFVDLPWRLYRGSEHWIPPLKSHVRRLLDPAKHPFWKFAERRLFIAKRGSQTVGRIAGIIDKNFIHFQQRNTAKWGFFECENDPEVAAALFTAVEDWSRSKGMVDLLGPMNPSTNYDVGLLVKGFEFPPVINMPYNPPYYEDLVSGCGHVKEQDLVAFLWDRESRMSPRMERLMQRWNGHQDIRMRPMDRSRVMREAGLVKEIYEQAWSKNWGFVPMTDDEIREMAAGLRWIEDPDLSFFVYYKDEPVAVCLILLDVNPLLKRLDGKLGLLGLFKLLLFRREVRGARLVLFGIKQSHQRIRSVFPFLALARLVELSREKHQYVEFSWILEQNKAITQIAQELGARAYKTYRVFTKGL